MAVQRETAELFGLMAEPAERLLDQGLLAAELLLLVQLPEEELRPQLERLAQRAARRRR